MPSPPAASAGPPQLPIALSLTRPRNSPPYAQVWDPETALHIRNELRLLGDFTGTLPKHTAQSQHLTLPLTLSQEELVFGVSRGWFHLHLDLPHAYRPQPDAPAEFARRRDQCVAAHVHEAVVRDAVERRRRRPRKRPREASQDQSEPPPKVPRLFFRPLHALWQFVVRIAPTPAALRDLALLLKGRYPVMENTNHEEEREERREEERELNASSQEYDHVRGDNKGDDDGDDGDDDVKINGDVNDDDHDDDHDVREELLAERARRQARHSAVVATETPTRPDEGFCPERFVGLLLDTPKLAVFKDLHARGYYMSCGGKFGADLLAYAGSPQLFHAAFAVIVVDGSSKMGARDIVALGRLGDATRKRTLLAFVNCGSVNYVGVQWEETLP